MKKYTNDEIKEMITTICEDKNALCGQRGAKNKNITDSKTKMRCKGRVHERNIYI